MPSAQVSRRCVKPWRNSAALPYSASPSTQPKRVPAASTRPTSSSAIRHLGWPVTVSGTPARRRRPGSPAHVSGRNRRRPTQTGTSPRARVSETSAWQFARLPRSPQYWRCTPTESLPCFTRAVSSTTSTAPGPPTSRSAVRASSASSGSVAQGEAAMKWCGCGTSPGATRAAIGSTLLRLPGSSRPFRYSGARCRRAERERADRKGASHRSNSAARPTDRERAMAPASRRPPLQRTPAGKVAE